MIRATSVVRKIAVKAEKVVDEVTMPADDRHRRRIALTGQGGLAFMLDLEKATQLNDGDAVKLEDGRLVRIVGAAEKLLKISAHSPARMLKLAWHIGNRHTPAEITEEAIYIERDHVLADMVRGLGGIVEEVERAFSPERGAYHDHGDHAGHDHHAHDHHGHAHHHAHGPDCGCGHDHAHDHDHKHGHHHHR